MDPLPHGSRAGQTAPGWSRNVWIWGGVFAAAIALAIGWWRIRSQQSTREVFEKGWAAVEQGDVQTAFQICRTLPRDAQAEPYRQLLEGAIFARRGQFEQAFSSLATPASFDPTAVRAWTLMAQCYYHHGHWANAVRAAQEALRRDEEALPARRWLAVAAYDLGMVGLAAEELKKIAAADVTDGRSLRLLGLIEKDRAEYPEAIEFYRESLHRQPDPPDRAAVLEELAQACVQVNDYDQALDALGDCPETPTVLVLRSQCFAGLGREDDRRKALETARRLAPDDLTTLTASAALALIDGEVDQALVWLDHAVAKHPADSATHYQYGQALERAGRKEDAQREFDLFNQWRKVEHEFSELHNAASADAENAELRVQLGRLAEKLRKPELAETWYKAALAIEPNLESARKGLSTLNGSVPGRRGGSR
ncbi:MAG: tetratricopeptide repeat protein [Planctomycetota bacterium]|nr:tetratricopeptide repeat protein [Planctomycetota bacterium]